MSAIVADPLNALSRDGKAHIQRDSSNIARKAAPEAAAARRLAELAAVGWVLEALEPSSVLLDLSAQPPAGGPKGSHATLLPRLDLVLRTAGIPVTPPSGDGRVRIDAPAFLGEAREAADLEGHTRSSRRAEALAVSLFVVSGIRASTAVHAEGNPALELAVPASGLSLRQAWFIADRLAWLKANAVLIGAGRHPVGRAPARLSAWLGRLVAAFVAEYGEDR